MGEAQVLLEQARPTVVFDEAHSLLCSHQVDCEWNLSNLTSMGDGNKGRLCSMKRPETYSVIRGEFAQFCHPGKPQH